MERIKVSNRIKKLANQIEQLPIKISRFADIGTDHGYLPFELLNRGVIKSSILCDVNEGPLQNAKQTFKGSKSSTDFRLGSGLEPLNKGEVDAVAIAGMGGGLIIDLLSCDLEKTKSYPLLLLQPMTEQDRLRAWLLENRFIILWDNFFIDLNKQYEVIMVYNPDCTLQDVGSSTANISLSASHLKTVFSNINDNQFKNPTEDLEFGFSINLAEVENYRSFLVFKKQKYFNVLSKISKEEHGEIYTATQKKLDTIDQIEKALDIIKITKDESS